MSENAFIAIDDLMNARSTMLCRATKITDDVYIRTEDVTQEATTSFFDVMQQSREHQLSRKKA